MAAAMVEQGETQDIQVLRITSAGRFFRCVGETPLPLPSMPGWVTLMVRCHH